MTSSPSRAVSIETLMRHVSEFAKRVKLSGTPEELESFRYLQATLDGYGFATRLIMHDAYISLPGQASLSIDGQALSCITHSFSRASPPDGLVGEIIDVGAGRAADFAAADARGKIALIDGLASPLPSLLASRAGAVGQIHVSAHEHRHEMCISPVWGSPTPETLDNLPRTVVVTVAQQDGAAIRDRLRRDGHLTARIDAQVDTGWRETPLLVAELGPPDAGDDEPFVLFSGHHDTWHFGVMDNGSANATMLEVARICAPERARWRRGLRLCFWSGHSHGRYSGSTWYADRNWAELERRCVAHVNCDSTGGRGATVLSDTPASAELRKLAADAVHSEGQQEHAGHRMSRAGDSSFWGIGIPSLFMGMSEQPAGQGANVAGAILGGAGEARKGAGFGWWWHTPDDTLDKIDPELLVRDTRIYVHAIWRLLADPLLPHDYSLFADDLARAISGLAGVLGDRFELGPLLTSLHVLRTKALALQAAGTDPRLVDRVNHALMRMSRALVPIDYTGADRFQHDPALPMPPYPSLAPLRALAGAPHESDEAKFLTVAAVRGVNRIRHAIELAIDAATI
jgi:hypothetical protein